MGKRSRPRRYERRAATAELQARRGSGATRWASRALVTSIVAWLAALALSAIVVSATDVSSFVWGIVWPSRRHGNVPLEVEVTRGAVVPLTTFLLACPIALALVGLIQTRERSREAREDRPHPLYIWSRAGVAALALVPNVLGCLWVSATSPGSDLVVLPEAWPAVCRFPWAGLVGRERTT
jgi:hypothetical protein